MKMSAIKSAQISVMYLTLALFASISVVSASNESNCLNRNVDLTNNLCEQNARHIMLQNNSSLLDKMFEKVERRNFNKPIMKQLIVTEVKEEIELTSIEDSVVPKLMPNFEAWPRPKVLSRNFEFAVNSLDTKGKKDLLYCAIMQTRGASAREMKWNTHQIDAVIQFSNQKLSGVNLSNKKLPVKHTPQECENLFSLVLGKT
ncbi:hypothetical protein OBA42_01470 [Paracoccaceae bacterium]|nr:hypothetical protein [Paracoccaceae bacterium]MDC3205241.1 hypothetical protein [Paracoccaceae bacterium]